MKSLRTYLLHLLWWIQYPFGHFMKMHDRELLVMNLNNLSNILERSCNFVCINIFNNNIISVLRKCHLLMSADVRSCNRRQTSRNITFRRWSYTDLYINLNTCRPIPCRPILDKKVTRVYIYGNQVLVTVGQRFRTVDGQCAVTSTCRSATMYSFQGCH